MFIVLWSRDHNNDPWMVITDDTPASTLSDAKLEENWKDLVLQTPSNRSIPLKEIQWFTKDDRFYLNSNQLDGSQFEISSSFDLSRGPHYFASLMKELRNPRLVSEFIEYRFDSILTDQGELVKPELDRCVFPDQKEFERRYQNWFECVFLCCNEVSSLCFFDFESYEIIYVESSNCENTEFWKAKWCSLAVVVDEDVHRFNRHKMVFQFNTDATEIRFFNPDSPDKYFSMYCENPIDKQWVDKCLSQILRHYVRSTTPSPNHPHPITSDLNHEKFCYAPRVLEARESAIVIQTKGSSEPPQHLDSIESIVQFFDSRTTLKNLEIRLGLGEQWIPLSDPTLILELKKNGHLWFFYKDFTAPSFVLQSAYLCHSLFYHLYRYGVMIMGYVSIPDPQIDLCRVRLSYRHGAKITISTKIKKFNLHKNQLVLESESQKNADRDYPKKVFIYPDQSSTIISQFKRFCPNSFVRLLLDPNSSGVSKSITLTKEIKLDPRIHKRVFLLPESIYDIDLFRFYSIDSTEYCVHFYSSWSTKDLLFSCSLQLKENRLFLKQLCKVLKNKINRILEPSELPTKFPFEFDGKTTFDTLTDFVDFCISNRIYVRTSDLCGETPFKLFYFFSQPSYYWRTKYTEKDQFNYTSCKDGFLFHTGPLISFQQQLDSKGLLNIESIPFVKPLPLFSQVQISTTHYVPSGTNVPDGTVEFSMDGSHSGLRMTFDDLVVIPRNPSITSMAFADVYCVSYRPEQPLCLISESVFKTIQESRPEYSATVNYITQLKPKTISFDQEKETFHINDNIRLICHHLPPKHIPFLFPTLSTTQST